MYMLKAGNRARLGFCFVAFLGWPLCTDSAAQAQSQQPPKEAPDKAAQIKALLKERCDVLEDAAAILREQYKRGSVDISRLAQAEGDILKANLDLDEGPEKRIAALRKYEQTADAIVKVADARFKVGQGSRVDVLQARALLLEARIALLREEFKAKPGKK